MRVVPVAVLAAAVVVLGAPLPASASQILDRNVANIRLAVNAKGEALVTFTRSVGQGQVRHVLAWGAVDAVAPDRSVAQQHFKLDYSGGWGKYRNARYWQKFTNVCRSYTGPPLSYVVAACTAPDGSHWALQSWQRVQPLRGVEAFLPEHMAWELHLSHWTTSLAVLNVSPNWTYGGQFQGLFGQFTYKGLPVYGFKTPKRGTSDRNARYVYIDTFNSAYGPGWKRDGAKVTHSGSGTFCYSFAPLLQPPPGYPYIPKVSGVGERHRVTAMGPGVTPDVVWEGSALGPYDPQADVAYNALFDSLLGSDKVCTAER